MKKIFICIAAVCLLLFLGAPPSHTAGPDTVDITILHVNDTHGHILPGIIKSISATKPVGGAAHLAAMIARERARNPEGTLLLSGGDAFQGTPVSNIFQGAPVVKIMNYLKFDAMVIGNHEFDWGLHVLERNINAARFPFLSGNIFEGNGSYLPGVLPFILCERKGVTIAIIGITTPETAVTTKPDNVQGLAFRRPQEVLPNLITAVKERDAQLIVVLSHSGLAADMEMARDVSGIDILVGGHSHTTITDPVTVGGTIIVQAGCFDSYLGVLNVAVDRTTARIVNYTANNELKTVYSSPGNPEDRVVADVMTHYHNRIKDEFSRVIGATSTDLLKNKTGESNEANLICDAMRDASGASIAFVNSGGIKIDIPKGPITREKIFELLPYDNVMVTMDLTGAQIMEILEQSASMDHGIIQVAGMSVIYDLQREEGHRVSHVRIGGRPLNSNAVYRIVTNDFLAAGGDGYATFTHGHNIRYGDDLRDTVTNFITTHSPVSVPLEGRITVKH